MSLRRILKLIIALVPLLLMGSVNFDAFGQFRKDAFTQSYNTDPAEDADSTDVLFSFKNYFRGLSHKEQVKIGVSFAGSTIFVGGQQIYNKQYWKLPLVYGSLAGTIGGGFYFSNAARSASDEAESSRLDKLSTACFVGAGVAYWATLLDGVACFPDDKYPLPGRATIYSILCPGMGQIYNGEYWKLPIYWGGMIGSAYFYSKNKTNYFRFKRIYQESTSNPDYNVPISSETALFYRNLYRRYRDYSILSFCAFYLIQVIDANVFAYMSNFEVAEDLALSVSPTVITPETQYASVFPQNSALGLKIGFRF